MKSFFFLIVLFVAGCAQKQIALIHFLKTSTISDPKTFNLIVADETSSTEAVGIMFESLLYRNPLTLEMEPRLAENYSVSQDGKIWTFTLRDNLMWSDGKPLTTFDVKFTFDVIYSPDIATSYKDILRIDHKKIKVKVVNRRTVKFILPRKFAPFLSTIGTLPILPSHVLKKPFEEGRFEEYWNISTPPSNIVGSGPYIMVEYVPSQFIRYKRNPYFFLRATKGDPLPYIKDRLLLIVSDMNTQFVKFRSGEIDIYYPRAEEIPDLIDVSKKLKIKLKKLGVATGIEFFSFNRNPKRYEGRNDAYKLKWFTNKNFLKAIAHAIDKKAMIVSSLAGLGEPAVSYISPAVKLFYNSGLKDYEYAPEKSRTLLKEAGFYDRDNDGWIEDKEGHQIEFNLYTNSGNRIRETICTIFVEDMKNIGIRVNFKPIEFNTLVEKLVSNYEWDAVLIGLTGGPEPHNGANFLRSSGKLHIWYPSQNAPSTEWEREIDKLVEEASRELDIMKRSGYYKKIQKILHDELPIIPTVRPHIYIAWKDRFENFIPTIWGLYKEEFIKFKQ